MKRISYISVVLFLSIVNLHAQQDPLFTQFMFNPFIYNPAYAGTQDYTVLNMQSRYQWVGAYEGINAPKTHVLNGHTLLNDEKTGLGGGVVYSQNSYVRQTCFSAAFSHRIIFKKATLSMGLSGGATHYMANYHELNLKDGDDASFNNGVAQTSILPNIGAGLFLYSERFYLGASLPRFINSPLSPGEAKYVRHYYINGGLVFPLGESFKIKPNAQMRITEAAAMQLDLNLNLLIYDVIWFGFSYRSLESIDLLLELNFSKRMRLGYSYDLGIGDFSPYHSGSHEFMLGYKFVPQEKEKEKSYSPRYF